MQSGFALRYMFPLEILKPVGYRRLLIRDGDLTPDQCDKMF